MTKRSQARQDRRIETRGGTPPTRYQMREKLISIGQDSYVEDANGQKVFHIDGKVMRVRDTLFFKDMQGNKLAKIQERKLRIKDSMKIEGADGERLALVKKALISPLRERWVAKIGDDPDLDVQGNILDHEYKIKAGRHKVAEVSKRWFRVRDTYGVEIEPGQNDIVILAITVAIDMMRKQ
jgi:uncharacterized protein YxjI